MQVQLGDISHIIQLAIAPVFLLTGVGSNLLILTSRLARIIDRTRVLEDEIDSGGEPAKARFQGELGTLRRRNYLINRAITLSTTCALLICVVIAALFLGDALRLGLSKFIAVLFILAMVALICSLVYLLREIFVATGALAVHGPQPDGK